MKKPACILFFLGIITSTHAQLSMLPEQNDRWRITTDGSIEWAIDNRLPHNDHVEMSGEKVSLWVQYGVGSDGQPSLNRTMVFPSFRLLPVRTIASMMYNVTDNELPRFLINDRLLKAGVYNAAATDNLPEKVVSIRQKGILQLNSVVGKDGTIALQRTLFPSVDKPVAIEKWVFTNTGKQPVKIEMEYLYRDVRPAEERTTPVQHSFVVSTVNEGLKTVAPGDSVQFALLYQAIDKNNPLASIKINDELNSRQQRLNNILSLMQMETPDPILNTAFSFAKIRATESIYKTKGGYLHGPGGLRYYAAIWANDQAEYINPFFAMLGDETGNKSAMNAYRWFARYMNDAYNPIPSSIIAEGDATWHGARDRGDMAMIAYGASRYALTFGNKDSAKVLWPLIEWCLEYLKRKLNENGVVASNSDELEGRFPAGRANLNTSILYYDALRSASMLGKLLNAPKEQTTQYASEAQTMRTNIEKFFGATVEGFNTYRYYEGNDTLRAWICSPLTVGLFERKAGTIAALFSPRLWTADGLASLAGNTTFWDRSTLYALRGVLAAGETEKAMEFLRYYSKRRLLGEHVPYAVEAYPEGNQRHLSAESGLYCRIYTEGLFGIRPVGFNSFECTPRLPNGWDRMALKNMHAFGNVFDIIVNRAGAGKLGITIKNGEKEKKYVVKEGATQLMQL
ncbi:hypothetical protein A3860_20895 [Niastella vici]|uniref:Six-hairpin glycosidase-like protein n=1 Tax=Niastella vici TaxID=1703345 RepID=A0A1V9G1A8_9BACT|nr:hypothetical protein [Niastella vici]OQP64429.1 hypothetical protein A3860_20895 [Niastella vici]